MGTTTAPSIGLIASSPSLAEHPGQQDEPEGQDREQGRGMRQRVANAFNRREKPGEDGIAFFRSIFFFFSAMKPPRGSESGQRCRSILHGRPHSSVVHCYDPHGGTANETLHAYN